VTLPDWPVLIALGVVFVIGFGSAWLKLTGVRSDRPLAFTSEPSPTDYLMFWVGAVLAFVLGVVVGANL
jgi:hypothetical protein